MEQVDARKVLAKAFELFELYPQVGMEDLPSMEVSTGYGERGGMGIIHFVDQLVDNIYLITRNHLGTSKYLVTREQGPYNQRDYINNVKDFLKLIKDSPITNISFNIDEDRTGFNLFYCGGEDCPEIQQWAAKTIQRKFRKSEGYIKWDENPYTKYRRGDFYKDPITGQPISDKERAAVDKMASNLIEKRQWKTYFGKSNTIGKDIKYLKSL